jgi:hypothetical protein
MSFIKITSGSDVPAAWGVRQKAMKKTLVSVREPNAPSEKFSLSWGELTAVPGEDVVIMAGGEEYPCKVDIFKETYREKEPGKFQKTALSEVVQVPQGVIAQVETKEGPIEVTFPDYVVIGVKNEAYANGEQWVKENLELVS